MKIKDIKTEEQIKEFLGNNNPLYAESQEYPEQMDYALRVEILTDYKKHVSIDMHRFFLHKFLKDGEIEQNIERVMKAFVPCMTKADFDLLMHSLEEDERNLLGLKEGKSLK